MKLLFNLAKANLFKQKRQTIVTIIGVILSTAMITGVISLVVSFQNFLLEDEIANEGRWHIKSSDQSSAEIEEAVNDASVKEVNPIYGLGYADFESLNSDKPYLYIASIDNFESEVTPPVIITEGRLPENSTEIIIPSHLSLYVENNYAIGDQLDLEIGYREIPGEENEYLGQDVRFTHTMDDREESIVNKETRSFTVVGFYERPEFEPFTAPGFTLLTTDAVIDPVNTKATYYIELDSIEDYEAYIERFGIDKFTEHTGLFRYSGNDRNEIVNSVITSLVIICLAIIIIGSVVLIQNAFNISLTERTKQFGLLSSIGASQKQLRKIVLIESFIIAAIGIPLGIASGLLGIMLTLGVVQNILNSVTFTAFKVPLTLTISWPSLVIAAVLALVTILISAYIPAIRSTRQTAIQAIRSNKDIVAKPVRVNGLVSKIFKTPGYLASKYYKTSKAKYRSTVISLTLSVVLFLSAYTFTNLMTQSNQSLYMSTDADISLTVNKSEATPDLAQQIKMTEGVEESRHYIETAMELIVSADDIDNYKLAEETYALTPLRDGLGILRPRVVFLEEKEYAEYVESIGVNPESLIATAESTTETVPSPIIYNKVFMFQPESTSYVNFNIFNKADAKIDLLGYQEIEGYLHAITGPLENGELGVMYYKEMSEPNEVESTTLTKSMNEATSIITTFSSSVLTDKLPEDITQRESLTLIFPYSAYDQVTAIQGEFQSFSNPIDAYLIDTSDHSQAMKELGILSQTQEGYANVSDIKGVQQDQYAMKLIIDIFSYGFIILITLIGLANAFNTITTNIYLRRTDFAMLRSVGMGRKDFDKMIMLESLLYSTRSLLLGLIIGTGLSLLIQKAFQQGIDTGYSIPWQPMLAVVAVILIFVTITMFYSVKKVRKVNVIEALKSEVSM